MRKLRKKRSDRQGVTNPLLLFNGVLPRMAHGRRDNTIGIAGGIVVGRDIQLIHGGVAPAVAGISEPSGGTANHDHQQIDGSSGKNSRMHYG